LFLAAWMFMSYFWLLAVIQIARDCNAEKLERQARSRLVFTVVTIILVASTSAIRLSGLLAGYEFYVSIAENLLMYVIIFVNLLFLHTCFVLITSEKQYEKDKQQIAVERAQALEKRQKEKEEAERFGKKRRK